MADTGNGAIVELSVPGMRVLRTLKLFTVKEHINTLAVWPPGAPGARGAGPSLWAVLHNLGDSMLVQVDLRSGKVAQRLKRVGNKSHGLSLYGQKAIMLSSGEGRLIAVDIPAAIKQGDAYVPEVLWEDPNQTFMKGLTGAPRPPARARPCMRLTRMHAARSHRGCGVFRDQQVGDARRPRRREQDQRGAWRRALQRVAACADGR